MPSAVRSLSWILGAVAAAYILLFAVLAVLRMGYPYELDWTESAYLDEVRWILAGRPVYAPPDIHFLPTGKTPFYFYAAAGMAKLLGEGFLPARLLSTLATLGCFGLIYDLVRRASASRIAALLAAGIYAGAYRFTGAWMDLAAVDSLFLFLTLLAFWVGLCHPDLAGQLASGVLFALAYYTKQLALPIAVALALVSLLVSRGRSWAQWAAAFGLGVGVFLAWDALSQGWFSFYTVEVPLRHPRVGDLLLFWKAFLPRMAPAALLALAYIAPTLQGLRRKTALQVEPCSFLALAAGLIAASWSIYIKVWTFENGLMPAVLGAALLGGLGFARLLRRLPLAALALALVQLALLAYNPAAQLPTPQTRQQAGEFIRWLQALPGDAWVFSHTYYGHLAGKETYFHSASYGDVMGAAPDRRPGPASDFDRRQAEVAAVFAEAVAARRFAWVIIDQPANFWQPYYLPAAGLEYDFYPLTGAKTRPTLLLAPAPPNMAYNLLDPLPRSGPHESPPTGFYQTSHLHRPVHPVGDRGNLRLPLQLGLR